MIKSKRRVAWMMLQNASVVSLDENVLMLRFPRQGDVKGFAAGQYDKLLEQALESRYGKKLVVRASSGPDTGPGGGGRRGPAGRGPTPVGPVSPAPAPAPPSVPAPEPGSPMGGSGTEGAPWPDAPTDDEPAPASQGAAPPRWGQERGARNEPRARREGGGSERPGGEWDSTDSDFDPDDEDMSSDSASPELTGVGLIQRELGGEVIAEFED
jgi:DNA polymerase-3 subunit gamma/tau